MKVCDLKESEIVVGLKVRGLTTGKIGTVVKIDRPPLDDDYAWIQWEGDTMPYSGFYGNDCQCEVVTN